MSDRPAHSLRASLRELESEALGLAAIGEAIAALIVAQQREYRWLLLCMAATCMVLSAIAAITTALILGTTTTDAIAIGVASSLPCAGVYFVFQREAGSGRTADDARKEDVR